VGASSTLADRGCVLGLICSSLHGDRSERVAYHSHVPKALGAPWGVPVSGSSMNSMICAYVRSGA